MRMWKIPPALLCRQHLLGEHNEMHKFVGAIEKKKSIDGYIKKGLVEVHNIQLRHDTLAEEMVRRGYKHYSPMTFHWDYGKVGRVDAKENLKVLTVRCTECRKRFLEDI